AEAVAEVARMGEQADRSFGAAAAGWGHGVAHRLGERDRGIAVVVAPAEPGEDQTTARPGRRQRPHRVDLVEVEIQVGDGITERMRMRRVTAMAHAAAVDGAGEVAAHAQRMPSARATSTALRMPS